MQNIQIAGEEKQDFFDEYNFISKKYLWILIFLYILFIFITLPVFPALIGYLNAFISKEYLNLLSLILSISFFLILSVRLFNKKYRGKQFLLIISPLLLLTYWSFSLDIWVERIHFIEYAILGLLVSSATPLRTMRGIIVTCSFITLTGVMDEIIQWILPNRVGDIRDVIMNSSGGFAGLWLGRFLFFKHILFERKT